MSPNSENQIVKTWSSYATWQKARDERIKNRNLELGEKLYQERSKYVGVGWKKIRGQIDHMHDFNKDERAKPSSERKADTFSAGGAWLANQMGRKDMIKESNTTAEAYVTAAEMSLFFRDFEDGAHAFITPWLHSRFQDYSKKWDTIKGWGRDFNFVARWSEAKKLIDEASAANGGGLWELEEELGIPEGQWVGECKQYGYAIYSYRISAENFKDLGLKMPSGFESGAYGSQWKYKSEYQDEGETKYKTKYYGSQDKQNLEKQKRYETEREAETRVLVERSLLDKGELAEFIEGEWIPFGATSGGNREGVLPAWDREEFHRKISEKVLAIELLNCFRANTEKVLAFGGWSTYKRRFRKA